MILRWALVAGLLLGVTTLTSAAETREPADASIAPTATRDFIFFYRKYPVFIRLQIQVDNASFETKWLKYVESVFREIDANSDGRVTQDETQGRADSVANEAKSILRMGDLWQADENPFDGAIVLSELTQFLINRGRGPMQPPSDQMRPPGDNGIGGVLFELLDSDEDQRLTAQEFANAAQTLRRRDLDDDATFSINELMPGRAPRSRPSTTTPASIAALVPGTAPANVLSQLVKRYRPPSDRVPASTDLSAGDLGIDEVVFAEFDVDSSQSLDYDELRRLVKNPPPTLELMIRLGDNQQAQVVELVHASKPSVSVRKTGQLVSIVLDDEQIEIVQLNSGVESVRRYLVEQFNNADQDGNNYLEEKEVQRSRIFNASFNEFDVDADGKMFEAELHASIDAKAKLAETRTRVTIQNRGRDLFQILDVDRNSNLSVREIAAAVERIELWDNDADGSVGPAEVPQMYQLALGPGQPVFRGLQVPDTANVGQEVQGSPKGPTWFQKMDRNNDGELLRREFPGTLAQFQALDTNRNGVVDVLEAAAAGRPAEM